MFKAEEDYLDAYFAFSDAIDAEEEAPDAEPRANLRLVRANERRQVSIEAVSNGDFVKALFDGERM